MREGTNSFVLFSLKRQAFFLALAILGGCSPTQVTFSPAALTNDSTEIPLGWGAPEVPRVDEENTTYRDAFEVRLSPPSVVRNGAELTLRYVLDQNTGLSCSTGTLYDNTPIKIENATFYLGVIACDQYEQSSALVERLFVYDGVGPAGLVSFGVASQPFSMSFELTLSHADTSALLRYNFDQSISSCQEGEPYSAPIAIPLKTTSVYALACDTSGNPSGVASATYTYDPNLVQIAAPTIFPASKNYKQPQSVSITLPASIANGFIRYSMGANPPANCTSGTAYTGPLTVQSTTTVVNAISCNGAGAKSTPVQMIYTYDNVAPTLSVLSPAANSTLNSDFQLSGNCETGGKEVKLVSTRLTRQAACANGVFSIAVKVSEINEGVNTLSVSQADQLDNTTTVQHILSRPNISMQAMQILQNKCISCHAGSQNKGGINYMDSQELLIANRKIIPGNPAPASRVYAAIQSGAMPTTGTKVTAAELAIIKEWIETLPEQKVPFDFELTPTQVCADTANKGYDERRLWLLSPQQIQNSVADILGVTTPIIQNFNTPFEALGYSNNAALNGYNEGFLNGIISSSNQVATAALARKATLLACTPGTTTRSCVQSFINEKGRLFYRREITTTEVNELLAVYDEGTRAKNSDFGFEGLVAALVQSPSFLYRTEVGTLVVNSNPERYALTDYEIASALAFTLTNSGPTAAQLDKAKNGVLHTAAQVRAETQAILNTAKAKAGLRAFFKDFFSLGRLDSLTKSTEVIANLSDALRNDMKEETLLFAEEAALGAGMGTLNSLYNSDFSYINQRLADHYKITGYSGSNTAFTKVSQSTVHPMSGVLSQASLMTINSNATEPSPIKRGKFVRERLLCQTLADPPPGVPQLPEISPGLSMKERFELHSSAPQCMFCHTLMDPIGFGFLKYDPVGRFSNSDDSGLIDTRGQINDGGDISGPFDGVVSLGRLLGNGKISASCFATNYFRYSLGRENRVEDRCELAKINTNFYNSNMSIKEMIMSMTSSEAFLIRK